jgi:trigger factor
VRVDDVKAKELPEPDDAFAVSLGFETWEQARAEIRAGLTASLEREAERAQREEFIDRLVAATTVELPAYLVNRRKAGLLQDLAEDLQRQQRMTLDAYVDTLEQRGTRAEFEAELQQAAERGVKRDLVLEALLERRGTTVSDDEFDAAVRQMAARRRLDVARFRSEMGETWLENYRFLLARDRAVREAVAEKTGRARREDPEADAEAAAAAAETAAHTEPEGRATQDD